MEVNFYKLDFPFPYFFSQPNKGVFYPSTFHPPNQTHMEEN